MPLLDPALPHPEAPRVKWGKLYGAAAALAIAEAAVQAKGPLIVIAQSTRDAEALSDEIRFFAGAALGVRVFPDLETLPYDSFSAHPDITSARLATLAELPRARSGVWLVAVDTLMQRLTPRSYVEAYSLKVHVGETLDLEALRRQRPAAFVHVELAAVEAAQTLAEALAEAEERLVVREDVTRAHDHDVEARHDDDQLAVVA